MGRLSGMSAVVTGGALGIGGGTARRLARDGADVLIVDVEESAANANAERIRSAGGNAVAITGDVAQEEAARGMVERAVAEFGRLDILVQNAYGGNSDRAGSAVDVSPAAWREGMDLLTGALFLGAKYAVPGHGVVRRRRPHRQHLVGPRAAHVARFACVRGRQVGRDRYDPSDGVRFRSVGNYGQRDSPGPHRHGTQRTNVEGKGQ